MDCMQGFTSPTQSAAAKVRMALQGDEPQRVWDLGMLLPFSVVDMLPSCRELRRVLSEKCRSARVGGVVSCHIPTRARHGLADWP